MSVNPYNHRRYVTSAGKRRREDAASLSGCQSSVSIREIEELGIRGSNWAGCTARGGSGCEGLYSLPDGVASTITL